YSFVTPRVLVEEFIEPENPTPPADYKFYCVDGSVRFMHFIFERGRNTKEQVVDRYGHDLGTGLHPSFTLSKGFQKPDKWKELIRVAEKLAEGFKCVRVDFYYSRERILAGEMTFWPMMGCYRGDGQKKLGTLLDFDRQSYKPLIHTGLVRPI